MEIVDLAPEHEAIYCQCLEEWSDEIREAGDHKREWYQSNRGRGLRVKLALDDAGTVGGMIQYLPVEHSPVDGSGLYFILCIWVHGYKQGRGDFQKKGMGTALLAAAVAGTPVAIRMKDRNAGKGYDGDCIVKYDHGVPLKGEQTVDFTFTPNRDLRTPQLYV